MLSKNMIITYRSFAIPIYLSFCVLLKILCPLLEKVAAYHTTNYTLFLPPNNLIDPPPLRYRNKKCSSTARPKLDTSKSASEHNFSGVDCNFRVFQGIYLGANKIKCFSGSSRVCWPPCHKRHKLDWRATCYIKHWAKLLVTNLAMISGLVSSSSIKKDNVAAVVSCPVKTNENNSATVAWMGKPWCWGNGSLAPKFFKGGGCLRMNKDTAKNLKLRRQWLV